jgi:hypothetical protein
MKNDRLFHLPVLTLSVIVLLELLCIVASAQVECGMELVRADSDKSWYLNTRSRVSPTPGTVTFWNKIVPSKGSPYFVQLGSILEKAGKNPSKMEYVQVLQSKDCATDKTVVLNIIFYDRLDRIIYSRTEPKNSEDIFAFPQESNNLRSSVCSTSDITAREKEGLLAEH